MTLPSSLGAVSALLLSAGLLVACTQKVETKKPLPKRPSVDTVQPFDVNGDGRSDAWRHYKLVDGKKVLARKEFDLNFDGRKDLARFYTETGAVERDEMDMDFDGRVDMICYYEGNKVVRKELLTNRGKTANATLTLKEYKQTGVNYLESDQDGDGKKETFFYFKEGRIVRRGIDTTGDGQPNQWEELE